MDTCQGDSGGPFVCQENGEKNATVLTNFFVFQNSERIDSIYVLSHSEMIGILIIS